MPQPPDEIEDAIEVFVRGFCATKSATHATTMAAEGRLTDMTNLP